MSEQVRFCKAGFNFTSVGGNSSITVLISEELKLGEGEIGFVYPPGNYTNGTEAQLKRGQKAQRLFWWK